MRVSGVGTRAAPSTGMHDTTSIRFRTTAFLLFASVAALSGCGEAGMFSRGQFREAMDANFGSAIDNTKVTLSHLSTRCGDGGAMTCPKGMAPAVEVHIEERSVIFDFSNVAEPGAFADVDFEGFLLEIAADANTPILFARIDPEVTNLEIGADAVTHDEGHLEVNFASVAYDSAGLVKIDLLAGPLNLFGQSQ